MFGGAGGAGGARGDGLQQVYHTFDLFGTQVDVTLGSSNALHFSECTVYLLPRLLPAEKLLMLLLVFFLGGARMVFAAVALFVLVTYLNAQKPSGGGGRTGGPRGTGGGGRLGGNPR